MTNVLTVFRREIKNYFNSPIAYIFMMLFLGLMGFFFFFFFPFFVQDDASMRYYFYATPWFFVFFAAAIAMRLWSEEKKVGTLELLLTMPLRSHEIVLGKFLAGLAIIFVTLILTAPVPISVAIAGDPDWGKIATGYLGAFFAGAFLLALGAFISATTENQIVALMVASVAGILLMALGIDFVVNGVNDFSDVILVVFAGVVGVVAGALIALQIARSALGGFVGGLIGAIVGLGVGILAVEVFDLQVRVGEALAYFSIWTHFENLTRGVVDLRDCIYFASMTVLALLLNHVAVEGRKY